MPARAPTITSDKIIKQSWELIARHPQATAMAARFSEFGLEFLSLDELMEIALRLFGSNKRLMVALKGDADPAIHSSLYISHDLFEDPEKIGVTTINNANKAWKKILDKHSFWILGDLAYPELARALVTYSDQTPDIAKDLYEKSLEKLTVKQLITVFNTVYTYAVRSGKADVDDNTREIRGFIAKLTANVRNRGATEGDKFKRFIDMLENGKVETAVLVSYPTSELSGLCQKVKNNPFIKEAATKKEPENNPLNAGDAILFLQDTLGLEPIPADSEGNYKKLVKNRANLLSHIRNGDFKAIKPAELQKLIVYWNGVVDDPLVSATAPIQVTINNKQKKICSISMLLQKNKTLAGWCAFANWAYQNGFYASFSDLGADHEILYERVRACAAGATRQRATFMTATAFAYEQFANAKGVRLEYP